MDRQEERRAHLALANRVRELESQLASATQQSSAIDDSVSSPASHGKGTPSTSNRTRSFTQYIPADTGSSASEPAPESSADAIATGLFDDQPSHADIGYFGASSNHAFFWSITSSLDELDKQRPDGQKLPSRHAAAKGGPKRLPLPPVKAITSERDASRQNDAFPGRDIAIKWTNCFFDTVAAILPYVHKSVLLREIDVVDSRTATWQSCPSGTQALLSIVFAHALAATEDGAAEPFYRRALGLLDEKGLNQPTIDSLQALLLLASFQQNSQRAQESITTQFCTVRTAYQLGIHSPSSYGRLSRREKELRSILWFAVVQLDRIVGCALGRPFLVPDQHVRIRPSEALVLGPQSHDGDSRSYQMIMMFFRHIISIHEIMGNTVDIIHASNISATHELNLSELVSHVMDLLRRLEHARSCMSPFELVLSGVDMSAWSASTFETERHAIVLSLYHYRATMLINAPLLLAVLRSISSISESNELRMQLNVAMSILQTYLQTIDSFHKLLCGILAQQRLFLRSNAVWWLCNYMAVSANLHLFGFWLISTNRSDPFPLLGMSSSEIEVLMRRTLDTLKLVGGSSIMSRKAHRCLHKYLDLFTSYGELFVVNNSLLINVPLMKVKWQDRARTKTNQVGDAEPAIPAEPCASGPWLYGISPSAMAATSSPGIWDGNVDDLLAGLNADNYLGADFFAMGYNISDFDATGFI
ncbi:hypothetical protein QQS21_001399 [Conoideocrella luteorostrata]|uniref:Xylanolytic transcriptional activator regulatory domain-containing protein n=1 Tax=Conoideocrella luteorostrata TaxID=1105319 RepID=A0AAJ0FXL3_9HYPO|nr:hypothetical protein QQS21_001399 [Conoideocrella luteorostrata]